MVARDIAEVVRFAGLIAGPSLSGVGCGSGASDGASDAGRAADATIDAGIDAEDASAADVASDARIDVDATGNAGIDADSAGDAPDAGADATGDSDTGSRSDANVSTCPPNGWCDCVCPPVNEGGVCLCDNFSLPQCPAGAGGGTPVAHAGMF
jgi:hypothetical protein